MTPLADIKAMQAARRAQTATAATEDRSFTKWVRQTQHERQILTNSDIKTGDLQPHDFIGRSGTLAEPGAVCTVCSRVLEHFIHERDSFVDDDITEQGQFRSQEAEPPTLHGDLEWDRPDPDRVWTLRQEFFVNRFGKREERWVWQSPARPRYRWRIQRMVNGQRETVWEQDPDLPGDLPPTSLRPRPSLAQTASELYERTKRAAEWMFEREIDDLVSGRSAALRPQLAS